MSPRGFEERVRQDIGMRELPTQIASTALVTDAEVDTYLRLHDQRRDFRFVRLARPATAKDGEVADSDIDAYYKAHPDEFKVPERVALDYIELDGTKLSVDLTPDEGTLRERYEKEKARFRRISAQGLRESHVHDVIITKEAPNYRVE